MTDAYDITGEGLALRFRLWRFYGFGVMLVFLVGVFLLGWYFGYKEGMAEGLTACKATCTEALKQYGLVVEGYVWK